MDEVLLRRAILDDPDDDAVRLAFADWLDANGKPDRAAWIRLSCEYASVGYGDERCRPLGAQVLESWKRCRPSWWEYIPGVDQENDRGIFRIVTGVGSSGRGPAPVKRLGKTAWLGLALDEGWLQRIELGWDDGRIGRMKGGFRVPAEACPGYAGVGWSPG